MTEDGLGDEPARARAASVVSRRYRPHSLFACTQHLHESTVPPRRRFGLATGKAKASTTASGTALTSPILASLYEKGGYKGASRLSVSPLSLNGAGWVFVSSATTGTFTVSSFQRKNLKMCALPRSLVARHWGYVIVIRN